MHSSSSAFFVLQTSFCNIFILAKMFCIRKHFFLLLLYSFYPLLVQNKQTKIKGNEKKELVIPGDFCCSHSHHYLSHNFYPFLFTFRFLWKWHWLVSPSTPKPFLYILISLSHFSHICHSSNVLFIYSLGIILYFAKLQSHQSESYCVINIFCHKANRTQWVFFLISGHYCKTICARTN